MAMVVSTTRPGNGRCRPTVVRSGRAGGRQQHGREARFADGSRAPPPDPPSSRGVCDRVCAERRGGVTHEQSQSGLVSGLSGETQPGGRHRQVRAGTPELDRAGGLPPKRPQRRATTAAVAIGGSRGTGTRASSRFRSTALTACRTVLCREDRGEDRGPLGVRVAASQRSGRSQASVTSGGCASARRLTAVVHVAGTVHRFVDAVPYCALQISYAVAH